METLHCDTYEGYIQAARDALALPEYIDAADGDDQYLTLLYGLIRHVRFARWAEYYEPYQPPLNPSKAQRIEARHLARELQERFDRWYAANREWKDDSNLLSARTTADIEALAKFAADGYDFPCLISKSRTVTEGEIITAINAGVWGIPFSAICSRA
ncbi:hypothetical protein [Rhodoferax sp.]|uniref:hypothetical protein n=1 Tax=Rhodoferax sp. TaxID=50421 RepID=UPI002842A319|nr:hypothetical protein [Rhodoferax sp.]MDR3371200.1 hypothetical protein [Rhodoferax sp.]